MYDSIRAMQDRSEAAPLMVDLPAPEFRHILALVAQDGSSNSAIMYITVGTLILFVTGVVLPAVWSRKAYRRKAALAVMDRVFKLLRPRA